MRYAQLNPMNLVINVLHEENAAFHVEPGQLWRHLENGMRLICLRDGHADPTTGQRYDEHDGEFRDDATWLSTRAADEGAYAGELAKEARALERELQLARADATADPEYVKDVEQAVAEKRALADGAKALSDAFAARAANATNPPAIAAA